MERGAFDVLPRGAREKQHPRDRVDDRIPRRPTAAAGARPRKDAFFMKPRMRRLPASTTPNNRHRPMKCSDSSIGHANGCENWK